MGKILDVYIDDLLARMNLRGEIRDKAETCFREALEKAAEAARQRGYTEERAEIEAAIRMNRPLLFSRTLWQFAEYRLYLFEILCRFIIFFAFVYILGKYFAPFWALFITPLALVIGDLRRAKKFPALFRDGLVLHQQFKESAVIPFENIEEIDTRKDDIFNLPVIRSIGILGQMTIKHDGKTETFSPAFLAYRPAAFLMLALVPDVFAPEIKARMDQIANGLFNIKPRFELAMPVHFRGALLALGLICLAVVGYCVPQLWVCDLTDMTLYAFAVLMLTALIGAFGFADRLRAGLCWLIAAPLPLLLWRGYLNMMAGDMLYFRWLGVALGGALFCLLTIFTKRISGHRLAVIFFAIVAALFFYSFIVPPLFGDRLETWAILSKEHVPPPTVWAGRQNQYVASMIKYGDNADKNKLIEYLLVAGAREFYRVPLSGSGWDLLPDETTDTLILGRWADNNFRAAPAQVFFLTPPERQLSEYKNPPSKYLISSIRPRESQPTIPKRWGKRVFAWKASPDGKKIFVLSELFQGRATKRIYLAKASIWDVERKRWTEIEAFNLAQSVIMLGLNAIQPYNISWSPDSRSVCYGSVRFLLRSKKRIDSGFNLRIARYEEWAEKHLK